MAAARRLCEGEAEGRVHHLHKRDLKRPGPQISCEESLFPSGHCALMVANHSLVLVVIVCLKQRHPEPHRHGEVFPFPRVGWMTVCPLLNGNRLGRERHMVLGVEIVEHAFPESGQQHFSLHGSVLRPPSPPPQMGTQAQRI
jgi:hypothetical protein